MSSGEWKLYVVECSDGTLYTGITTEVDRRIREHNEEKTGARYTRSRRPVTLVASWQCESHSLAAQLEYAFKTLTRRQKLQRIERGEIHDLLEHS